MLGCKLEHIVFDEYQVSDIFQQLGIAEACRFWVALHETFLEDSAAFRNLVALVTYDGLVTAPDATLERAARIAALEPRATPKASRQDRPNEQGYGIRNVVGGRIQVLSDAREQAVERLSSEAKAMIAKRASPVYERLIATFDV